MHSRLDLNMFQPLSDEIQEKTSPLQIDYVPPTRRCRSVTNRQVCHGPAVEDRGQNGQIYRSIARQADEDIIQ